MWPSEALPRTEGTRKLKRREIKDWVDAGGAPDAATLRRRARRADRVDRRALRARRAPISRRDTTIDELGLSSLERVELLMALEERFQTTLDEAAYADGADGRRSSRALRRDARIDAERDCCTGLGRIA